MSELLSRAGALFVAPSAVPARHGAVKASVADIAGVLAPAGSLAAAAGGVAAGLRHAHRARTALVLAPGGGTPPRPAFPAAPRALARRLAARDLPASAAGAIVRVDLPADPVDGVREAWRAVAAAAGVPAVIALSSRCDGYDELLAHCDELLLAPPATVDPSLAELALASLATLGPPAALLTPPAGFATRRLATLGLIRLTPRPTEAPA